MQPLMQLVTHGESGAFALPDTKRRAAALPSHAAVVRTRTGRVKPARTGRRARSTAGYAQSDEARVLAVDYPEEDRLAAVIARCLDLTLEFIRARHLHVADRRDQVTLLEAAIGGAAVRVDLGDEDTVVLLCRREREPEAVADRRRWLGGSGPSLLVGIRQRSELYRNVTLLSVPPDRQGDGRPRRVGGDPDRQITGILYFLAIDREDGIAGGDARLGCRAVRLRLRDQRALGAVELEAFRDLGGDRLDLDAEPAAYHLSLVAKRGDDALRGRGGNSKSDADAAA